ncbi:hypothetical protein BU24DRAFT_419438 [Aaosphaeria arxii CBS 175.79]|uniref:Protein kinase domain-containing protein n=1 Tax=Aaosphaeria arxii CBS 175.79 TaxID=1450172 RepID=A0A6A5Y3I7_9PLEO|nr:uncharacterized protein BU24DRAFT_419438 [Aaosphaeria arxii CBS 175.79]KAF2019826.1 hypothetical protein BU24DRAFT_419438 [Aaosphaeria arxii CBS 175.79]
METFGGFPRRLTQLYSDTKTSCDTVVKQDTPNTLTGENPLYRTFRIQKERLISWGMEWTDTTKDKQGDIDESVERAGLTETVSSVLGRIKEILDEAESLQVPAAVHGGAKTMSGEKSSGRPSDPALWAASERSRYETLAENLTTSIDVLYDLSSSRRHSRESGHLTPTATVKSHHDRIKSSSAARAIFSLPEYSDSDVTLINPRTLPVSTLLSSHLNDLPQKQDPTVLPQKLDIADLELPSHEPPPSYESVSSAIRVIGKLRSRHSSTNPWKTDGSKSIQEHVLVEYAAFDSGYRDTGVPPTTTRLDRLLALLSQFSSAQSSYSTLKCLGYFEDPHHPRFGIVFQLPTSVYSGATDSSSRQIDFEPVTLLNALQTGSKTLHNSSSATPPLEERFFLAFTLARTFQKIHGENFTHKDVNSSNILLFKKNRSQTQSRNSRSLQYQLRTPIISSFDLFSEFSLEDSRNMSKPNFYHHPEDPKHTGFKPRNDGRQFDLYSLGLILLEIGLWMPLSDLWKDKYSLVDFKERIRSVYIRRLASKCTTTYQQAVADCFLAADRIANGEVLQENFMQIYEPILIRLKKCCSLDEADTDLQWEKPKMPLAATASTSPSAKRKSISVAQTAETPQSPSHRAKRWAYEKGSQYLERAQSLSKTLSEATTSPKHSPNPSLSRNGSQRSQKSQHNILRKPFSNSVTTFKSPVEEHAPTMDWRPQNEEERSMSLNDLHSTSMTPLGYRSDVSVIQKRDLDQAASIIQRAWRKTRSAHETDLPHSMTFKDYKDRITLLQKTWRQKKERTNTVGTLISVANTQMMSYAGRPERELYPTPEPEIEHHKVSEQPQLDTSIIQIERESEPKTRPKLRIQRTKFSEHIYEEFGKEMLPRLERLLERALKKSDETVAIDLLAIGDTEEKARPTVCITCSSTARVKAILDQRFKYDSDVYDLKVRRGKIRRSKMSRSSRRGKPPHRSMMNMDSSADTGVMNPFHQQRPVCGASIGAYLGEHLPPVSYGGVILVDDEPLGMSVHHLLDAPSEDEGEYSDDDDDYDDDFSGDEAVLSSARSGGNPWLMGMGSQPGVQVSAPEFSGTWPLEISDDEDDDDEDPYEFSSDEGFDSDEESEDDLKGSIMSRGTIGDIRGVAIGEGKDIKITQPAIDDVNDDFFPCEEDRDDDHLSSHELGYVHASSGIRRWERDGVVHEIDWSLLKLKEERLQPYNVVQGGRMYCSSSEVAPEQLDIREKLATPVTRHRYEEKQDEYPNGVAKVDELGGLLVHCNGRTSGLQAGMVGHQMSSVRIHRRKSFARSWYVLGSFGVGGDSGAWVIQNNTHNVVGHVLAYCEVNKLAYICPMEVLFEDIKRTLGAERIYLPGSREQASPSVQSVSPAPSYRESESSKVEDLQVAIKRLDLDSGIDVSSKVGSTSSARASPTRSRFGGTAGLPGLQPMGKDSDKENLPMLRSSKIINIQESRDGGLEMIGVP